MGWPGGKGTQGVPGAWGAPSPSLQPWGGLCRYRERSWTQRREGVNRIRVFPPPPLLNSLIHFLCSYFFLSLSSSLSCRLIKNSLSLKVFVSKQLSCQLGAKR